MYRYCCSSPVRILRYAVRSSLVIIARTGERFGRFDIWYGEAKKRGDAGESRKLLAGHVERREDVHGTAC